MKPPPFHPCDHSITSSASDRFERLILCIAGTIPGVLLLAMTASAATTPPRLQTHSRNPPSIELNSILGGELMDISDRNCWRLSRCDRVVRCGKRCHPHELFKSRGREHEEIV